MQRCLKARQGMTCEGTVLGRVVQVARSGTVLVDFEANQLGHLPALLTHRFVQSARAVGDLVGHRVLLTFVNGQADQPVISDLVLDCLAPKLVEALPGSDRHRTLELSARHVRIEADGGLELRCGKSCIELCPDGRVSVRGEYLVTKSRGAQVIKGSAIKLN